VIPTVLVPAILIGRWWLLPVAVVAWPLMVLSIGSCDLACSAVAGALAAMNTAVGVVVHKALSWLIQQGRKTRAGP
jgi:hypothetical protein